MGPAFSPHPTHPLDSRAETRFPPLTATPRVLLFPHPSTTRMPCRSLGLHWRPMSPPPSPPPPSSAQSTVLGWLLPPLFLAAVGTGLWFVFNTPSDILTWGAGFLLLLSLVWVLISTLFPRGPAERICPACGADTLVRAEAESTSGLVCKSCLWRDDEISSFLLAEEEEGPIETTVLERRRKRARPIVIRPWSGSKAATERDSAPPPPASPEPPTSSS